jgi:hypothetical protein
VVLYLPLFWEKQNHTKPSLPSPFSLAFEMVRQWLISGRTAFALNEISIYDVCT